MSRRDDILIENTIYYALEKQPFIGNMLQILQIKYASWLPTAGITYDVKAKSFIMYINKEFFEKLTTSERCAIFFHEIYHVLHKHLVSVAQNLYTSSMEEKMKWNISMDLSINQYIEHLPTQAMMPEKFKAVGGGALALERSFEYYYDNVDWDQAKKDFGHQADPNCPVHGQGQGQSMPGEGGEGQEGSGEESKDSQQEAKEGHGSGAGQHQHSKEGKQCSCKGGLSPLDDHGLMEESKSNASEEEMLKAMGDLMRRTQQKTQYGYSTAPKFVQDLLNEIDKRLSQIDYKRVLAKAIRKSLPASDRTTTWRRPSKRFGYQAPGTKDGQVPNVGIFIDTSGSISVDELNSFLSEVDEILKTTKSQTMVHLFHTNLYFSTKFKRGYGVDKLSLQSGGTDLQDCFDKLKTMKIDTAIFITDGYYSDVNVDYTPHYNTVFVISSGGDVQHPLKRLGDTVKIT